MRKQTELGWPHHLHSIYNFKLPEVNCVFLMNIAALSVSPRSSLPSTVGFVTSQSTSFHLIFPFLSHPSLWSVPTLLLFSYLFLFLLPPLPSLFVHFGISLLVCERFSHFSLAPQTRISLPLAFVPSHSLSPKITQIMLKSYKDGWWCFHIAKSSLTHLAWERTGQLELITDLINHSHDFSRFTSPFTHLFLLHAVILCIRMLKGKGSNCVAEWQRLRVQD